MRGALGPGEQDAGRRVAVYRVPGRAPARGREQRRGEQRQRERPFQFLGENGIGEPGREQFALRCPAAVAPEGAAGELERPRGGERRRPGAGGAGLGGLDRRLQRVVAGEVQGRGGDRDRGSPSSYGSGGERAPGPQPASRRSGIGAGASEVERVAQRRLVFVAAGAGDAGGRGMQGEALAPGAGPGRIFAHDRIEPGERGAGEEGGFGRGFGRVQGARPGRERRRGGGRGAWDGGRIGAREHAGRYPIAALLASPWGQNRRARRVDLHVR